MRFREMQFRSSSNGIRDSPHDEIWPRYQKAICQGHSSRSRRAFPPSVSRACATRSFTNPLPRCLLLSLSPPLPALSSFSLLAINPSPLCILYLARAYSQRHPHPRLSASTPFFPQPLVNPGDVQLLGKVRVQPRHQSCRLSEEMRRS